MHTLAAVWCCTNGLLEGGLNIRSVEAVRGQAGQVSPSSFKSNTLQLAVAWMLLRAELGAGVRLLRRYRFDPVHLGYGWPRRRRAELGSYLVRTTMRVGLGCLLGYSGFKRTGFHMKKAQRDYQDTV